MTTPRQAVEALVGALPDGAAVTLPVEWCRELLGGTEAADNAPAVLPAADLTVEQVAERYGKAPSTVRGWALSGRLKGYRFGRELRFPAAALADFEQRSRTQEHTPPAIRRRGAIPNLGAWRTVGVKL